MSDVLDALPRLARGVQFYDRPLKERGPDGEVRDVGGVRLLQLYKRDAPQDKRLATLMVRYDSEETAVELAQTLFEHCQEYGYFAQEPYNEPR